MWHGWGVSREEESTNKLLGPEEFYLFLFCMQYYWQASNYLILLLLLPQLRDGDTIIFY
jgi:hypothetical protein